MKTENTPILHFCSVINIIIKPPSTLIDPFGSLGWYCIFFSTESKKKWKSFQVLLMSHIYVRYMWEQTEKPVVLPIYINTFLLILSPACRIWWKLAKKLQITSTPLASPSIPKHVWESKASKMWHPSSRSLFYLSFLCGNIIVEDGIVLLWRAD